MFAAAEKTMAASISARLAAFGAARDAMTEQMFHLTYGSPFLQALVGLDAKSVEDDRRPEREARREEAKSKRQRESSKSCSKRAAQPKPPCGRSSTSAAAEGGADERSFAVLQELHDTQPPGRAALHGSSSRRRSREQSLLLRLDEARAVAAIPKLLPADRDERGRTLRAVERRRRRPGPLSAEGERRLAQIVKLFDRPGGQGRQQGGVDAR